MQLANTEKALANGLQVLVAAMREQLQITGANATGETSRSLTSQMQAARANVVRGQVLGKSTWYYTDEGRKAGRRPPIDAIEQWVKVKIGVRGKEARALAFAFANKIAKEGTNRPPSNFAKTAIRLQTPRLRQNVARGLREDVRAAMRFR